MPLDNPGTPGSTTMTPMNPEDVRELAFESAVTIASAYASSGSVSASSGASAAEMINSVFTASFDAASRMLSPVSAKPAVLPVPAVPIKKSVTTDYLISLEDGRKYKTLRHHLSARGMTPEEYRAKWGLPAEYPMVAPSYAAYRSETAKQNGLGRNNKKARR